MGTLLSAITGLLVVVLVAAFAVSALSAYHREQRARAVLSAVNEARSIMTAKIAARIELGTANLVLEAPQAASAAKIARLRRLHVRLYQALSVVFTPFYQSDSLLLPLIRDQLVAPLSRPRWASWLLARIVAGRLVDPLQGLAAFRDAPEA